jgi:hypothetical protein
MVALACYWQRNQDAVGSAPMPDLPWPPAEPLPPAMALVPLPDWASDIGIDGALLVPAHRISPGDGELFTRTDWLGAACWFAHGLAERTYENSHGPIHSYSHRLRGWDARIWTHAWANRIAMFLRRWAARRLGQEEHAMFGPTPRAEIVISHDIDALWMTWALRIKQGAFQAYNALKELARGSLGSATSRACAAVRIGCGKGSLLHMEEVAAAERELGLSSHFFVYARARNRSAKLRLFDPHYDITRTALPDMLQILLQQGFPIGLHQSFDSWRDTGAMAGERSRLEHSIGVPVVSCRQHWLRFSWAETWAAQYRAGLTTDFTLGFNDRPGFRNGAAVKMRPWSGSGGGLLGIEALPMVFMDSHLYDYSSLDDDGRRREIDHWINELRAVGGTASILWHPHTLGPEYGWKTGFLALLHRLSEKTN